MSVYDEIIREQREEARKGDDAWVRLARSKSEVMAEYVMRDERGNRFVNGEHHSRLHAAMRCYRRLVVMWPPEFGKSEQLSSLVMHILGRSTDPEYRDDPPMYRGAFIGPSFATAAKSLRNIKNYLLTSADLKRVWPNLRPATGPAELWSQEAINVTRPPSVRLKDPSLQALGANGPILGSRLDFVILDDTLTFENTRTPDQREAYWEWLNSTVLTRIDEGGLVVFLTNAWHPNDAAHRLIEMGWPSLVEPALDMEGEPLWKERWSKQRVLDKIEELGPIEGPRKMMHVARDEQSMRFTPAMVGVALARGQGLDLMDRARPINGFKTYTGVDLGVSQTKRRTAGRTTGLTSFFTILKHPSKVRQVIDIQSGRWEAGTIMQMALEKHRAFESILWVENNAAQDLFVQMLARMFPIPVHPYTTGAAAAHPEFGLEKVGVEMRNGLWIVPCDRLSRAKGEVYDWIQELYDYRPNQHVGDRVRAMMFAWEGARMSEQHTEGRTMRLLNR